MTLDADIRQLADRVRPFNPLSASRLDALGQDFASGTALQRWSGIDLLRVIDPAKVVSPLRAGPAEDHSLGKLERWRNFLALAPVLLTWMGLLYAGASYRAAIAADPSLIGRPFLLLWEEHFQGHAPFPFSLLGFLTLSNVALLDIAIIAAMLVLTWRIHTAVNVAQVAREREASEVEEQLHQILWWASLMIAERTSLQAGIDKFREAADGLLDELRAERERIAQLANERERATGDLSHFAGEFRKGVAGLIRYSNEMRGTFNALLQASEGIDQRIHGLTQQHQLLEAALNAVSSGLSGYQQSYRHASEQLSGSSRLLVEAAEHSVAANVGVQDVVGQLRAELADLRQQLVAERAAYQAAAQVADRSASTLAQALQGTATASQSLQHGAQAMQDLLIPLSSLPAHLGDAARQQAGAAATTSTAAAQISAAVQGAEARLHSSTDALARSAQALDTVVPALHSVASAGAQLELQTQEVIRTVHIWGQELRAQGSNGHSGGSRSLLSRVFGPKKG